MSEDGLKNWRWMYWDGDVTCILFLTPLTLWSDHPFCPFYVWLPSPSGHRPFCPFYVWLPSPSSQIILFAHFMSDFPHPLVIVLFPHFIFYFPHRLVIVLFPILCLTSLTLWSSSFSVFYFWIPPLSSHRPFCPFYFLIPAPSGHCPFPPILFLTSLTLVLFLLYVLRC